MRMHGRRGTVAGHDGARTPQPALGHVPPPPAPVRWEDFLDWLEEDVHAEWVDGEIIEMSPASDEHQRIAGFLYVLLWIFVQERQLGEVFQPPFLMRLSTRPSGREPDLLFVSTAHAGRVLSTYVDGPADLVFEVVSPDSAGRDLREKLAEYEAAGVSEYWIIDPLRHEERFFQLGDNGRYRSVPVDAGGIYTSRAVEGFRLRVSWLWQRPFLTPAQSWADLPEGGVGESRG